MSRRRRHKHEEHVNHEAWAIPYADLVTLLLGFFVVMYAISSVNEGKYRVLSDSLFAAFRGAPRTMEPIQVGEKQVGNGADITTSLVQQSMLEGQPRSMLTPVPVQTGTPQIAMSHKAAAASKALAKVADAVEKAMQSMVDARLVVVRRTDFWIEVEIRTDILFPSASARLSPSAIGVIEQLGGTLAPFPNPIRVEGFTDNRPIKTLAFFSNWELSAARAGSVVHVLASKGIAPNRLAVIGYGENRPTTTNDTEEGRNANRRVVVVILSTDLVRQNDPAGLRSSDPGQAVAPVAPPASTTLTMNTVTDTGAATTKPISGTLDRIAPMNASLQDAKFTPPGDVDGTPIDALEARTTPARANNGAGTPGGSNNPIAANASGPSLAASATAAGSESGGANAAAAGVAGANGSGATNGAEAAPGARPPIPRPSRRQPDVGISVRPSPASNPSPATTPRIESNSPSNAPVDANGTASQPTRRAAPIASRYRSAPIARDILSARRGMDSAP